MYSANSWKLASFQNYNDAKNYWENAKPWRGKDPSVRPAGTRRQTTTTVRKDGDDFVVRFHNTDVVRFMPNGSVAFEAYASQSTNAIARRFTPPGVLLDYNSHGFFVGILEKEPRPGEKYTDWIMTKVGQKFKLHPNGEGDWIIEGAQTIKRTLVDVKAANKIYKESGYKDFAAFMRAAEKLNPPEELPYWQRSKQNWDRRVSRQYVIEMFKDGLEGWSTLVDQLPRPTQVLEVVRAHLIKENDCLKHTDVDSVTGWHAIRSVASYNRKWGG